MWLVYAWVNPTALKIHKTLIVYSFHDVDKMVKKLAEFSKICDKKNISFKYNVVEQERDE